MHCVEPGDTAARASLPEKNREAEVGARHMQGTTGQEPGHSMTRENVFTHVGWG